MEETLDLLESIYGFFATLVTTVIITSRAVIVPIATVLTTETIG